METSSLYHPIKNKNYSSIPLEKIPVGESLKDTFNRVVPYYEKEIEPLILQRKNILISAHGNSLRALCKKILNISKKKIITFEIPTGNPMLITFDKKFIVKKYRYLDKKRSMDFSNYT